MKEDYLIIHKNALPDFYEKVLEIKNLINQGENVSNACRELGISRSTFYKYKEVVFLPTKTIGRKIILSMKLMDEPGALSNILNQVAANHANILSIHQEMPIHNIAFVTLTIALLDGNAIVDEILEILRKQNHVIDVMLIAVE